MADVVNVVSVPTSLTVKVTIGDFSTTDIVSIGFTKSLNSITSQLDLVLPYSTDLLKSGEAQIKKFDVVTLTINDKPFFSGYVDNVGANSGKRSASIKVKCLETSGLLNTNMLPVEFPGGDGLFFGDIPDIIASFTTLPFTVVIDEPLLGFAVKVPSTKSLMEIFTDIKRNFPVYIYMNATNQLIFKMPSFLLGEEVTAWQFRYGENITSLNVANVYGDKNMVIAVSNIGNEFITGIAIDLIGLQLTGVLNYTVLQNNELLSEEDCENYATDQLLKISQNYVIDIEAPFVLGLNVGDGLQVKGFPELVEEEAIYRIKSITYNISKTSATMTISAFLQALPSLPQSIVKGSYRVAQANYLVQK